MKNKLFTLLIAIVASIGTSNAVKIGSLYYSLNNTDKTANVIKPEDGTVYDLVNVSIPSYIDYANESQESVHYSVVGVARYAFEDCSSLTSLTLPNTMQGLGDEAFCRCTGLTSVTIPNSVTYMGWNVFSECTNLTSVELGNSISEMGWRCFGHCTSLTSITIPSTLENIPLSAFDACSNLSSVIISDGVKTIGDGAFSGCTSLTEIIIPNSITKIEDSAFSGCSGLTSVVWNAQNCTSSCFFGSQVESFTFGNEVESIPANCCFGMNKLTSITIPNSVTSIGSHAFRNCTGLTSITIPNSVTIIGGYVFMDCSGLTSVTIGNSVTSIGDYAFANCSGLTSVTIPNSVTNIRDYVFSGCSGLTSVTIPNSVTSIGSSAFYGCSGLTSVMLPNGITSIEGYVFYDCSGLTGVTIPNSVTSIGDYAFANCSGLKSIEIPNQVTSIGNSAFSGCTGLIGELVIPNSVTSIESGAFFGCFGLTSVDIPNSLTSIDNIVFKGCSGLTSVTIPNSVTSIGNSAFYECTGLTSITIQNSNPPQLGYWVFNGVDKNIPLYVPEESIETYKTTSQWNDFTNIRAIGSITYYTVSFVDWDETVLKSEQVEEYKSATAPADPEREGYTFTGWDKDFTNVQSDLTVTAQYKMNRYEVLFLDWDETVLKKDSVNHGEDAVAPSNPEREGYTFTGWDKDFTNVQSDMTVTALYEENVPEPSKQAIISWQIGENGAEATAANEIIGAVGSEAEGVKIAITGNTEKTWLKGNGSVTYNDKAYRTIKNSNGAQSTFTLPAGQKTNKVEFYVVTNNATTEAVLSEFNGTICEDVVTSLQDYDNPTYICKTLAEPVNEFTFTFKVKQVCFIAIISYVGTATDIESPNSMEENSSSCKIFRNGQIFILRGTHTYTITGQEVR